MLSDQSGYGKQYLDQKGDLVPRPYSVTVEVTNRDSSQQTSGSASVIPTDPSVSFYTVDPLYGPLFNKALGDTITIGSQKETSIIAVPWGFEKFSNFAGDIIRSWTINGVDHPELNSSDIVVLRAPDGSTGSSNIALNMTSRSNILERLRGGFTVQYK